MAGRLLTLLGAALLARASFASPASWSGAKPEDAPLDSAVQVSRDLVRIDARVTDAAGRPITDLRAADFTLEVDGEKQRITQAGFSGGDSGSRAASFIFMVDDLNTSYPSLFLARDAVRGFGGRWNPAQDLVAVRLTSDKEGAVTLSGSPERFDKAIEAMQFNTAGEKETSRAQQPAPRLDLPFGVNLDLSPKVESVVVGGEVLPVDLSPIEVPEVLPPDNSQQRLYCLLSTIQGMKSLPGRKALILVGGRLLSREGQPMDEVSVNTPFAPFVDGRSENSALRTIVEVANRASVVVYVIDPSRLTPDRSGAQAARLREQASLRWLAEETGGIALFDRDGLSNGLSQIVSDQRSGYQIAFKPPKRAFTRVAGKPGFHRITLAVNRPDAMVRTRAGFFGVADQEVEGPRR